VALTVLFVAFTVLFVAVTVLFVALTVLFLAVTVLFVALTVLFVESADVEEKARDDFDFRVYETPVRPDKGAEARIAKKLWHIALEPGLCPGSHGTTVLEHSNPTS